MIELKKVTKVYRMSKVEVPALSPYFPVRIKV